MMRLFAHQFRVEQKVFWRNRESAVFIFIFPIMLFVLLASVYGGTIEIGGVEYPAEYALLAGLLSYGAANTAFAGLAITLVIRREAGLLKRLRSTPLPAPAYLGGRGRLDARRLRAPDGGAVRARPARVRNEASTQRPARSRCSS